MAFDREAQLAQLIWDEYLRETEAGHCARVDYLERDEAYEICRALTGTAPEGQLLARVLLRNSAVEGGDATLSISIDQAIEMRNRKEMRLCLFVPSDLVDASVSSLANSFAVIDGRDLLAAVMEDLEQTLVPQAKEIWRDVSQQLRYLKQVGIENRMEFLQELRRLAEEDALDDAGRELWRVGLVVDGATDFRDRLAKNRKVTQDLSRPSAVGMRTSTRIRSLRLEDEDAQRVAQALGNRELFDVRAWSRALLETEGATFDNWKFQTDDESTDLPSEVIVNPFLTAEGTVERGCKLTQPDGAGGALFAVTGAGKKVTVRWKTAPASARTGGWRIEMLLNGMMEEEAPEIDLPFKEVPGLRKSATLSLDFDSEDIPTGPYVLRVTALDDSHNPIPATSEEGEEITLCDDSTEFYLGGEEIQPTLTKRKTTSSISLGRLHAALEGKEKDLHETEAGWVAGDEYFSVKLNERRVLNVQTSPLLIAVEREVINSPRSGGSWILRLPEMREAMRDDLQEFSVQTSGEGWEEFLRERQRFFNGIGKVAKRNALEAADWTSTLANTAVSYGLAYARLLGQLIEAGATPQEMRAALCIDTILVEVAASGDVVERSLVVLPTHPIRSAWIAGYTQLLAQWEKTVLEMPQARRRGSVDRIALAQLAPANCPPLGISPTTHDRFIFFENLTLFNGVLLPDSVTDPQRRMADLQTIFAIAGSASAAQAAHSRRLADYVNRYLELHPYVSALDVATVNAGCAPLVVDALKQSLKRDAGSEDGMGAVAPVDSLSLDFYTAEGTSTLEGGSSLFAPLTTLLPGSAGNPLRPALRVSMRPLTRLEEGISEGAHLAFVADWSHARVAISTAAVEGNEGGYFLYGLVAQPAPIRASGTTSDRWEYGMISNSGEKATQHPAGAKYGTVLPQLHEAHNRALSHALGADAGSRTVIAVDLGNEVKNALESIHRQSDWVVTLDRFFPLELFDSPGKLMHAAAAAQYLLDYAPEYGEGITHRMMLTTDKRAEVANTLAQAMDELGFRAIEQSTRNLMQHMKTISGRLVLDAFDSTNRARSAIGMAMVSSWLARHGRLHNSVLVPVDPNLAYFSPVSASSATQSGRRCDLILFAFNKQGLEATMIEVKWRQGSTPVQHLVTGMIEQMEATAAVFSDRYFSNARVDTLLQRSMLASLLRFYCRRAERYGLLSQGNAASLHQAIGRLESTRVELHTEMEGFVSRLDEQPLELPTVARAALHVLTPASFEIEEATI